MVAILNVEPELLVPSYTTNSQSDVDSASLADGGYVLVWQSDGQDGSANGIYAQRFDADGTKVGVEFRVNTTVSYNQLAPSVTGLMDGGYVITWYSYQDGSLPNIYSQRYSATGVAVGTEFRVNTTNTEDVYSSQVTALAGGGFVVTWTSLYLVSGDYTEGVFGQRYTAAGVAVGAEFRVNTTAGYHTSLDTVGLNDGGFVVVWSIQGGGYNSFDVVMQRYNAGGTRVGGEITVNSTTTNVQLTPAITRLEDGGFVIVWHGQVNDFSTEILGQRYDASGNAVGGEFIVNTTQTADQRLADVTAMSDGGFIVTWESQDQDGSGAGVYTQRYDAYGDKVGPEIQVNGWTASTQGQPTIVAMPDGGYTVAWSSFGQDNSSNGIYQRAYTSATSLSGAQVLYGTGDDDILDGGSGADSMYGGMGNDSYFVNSYGDVVLERTGEGYDTVFASLSYSLSSLTHVESLVLTGFAEITASGNALNNIIIGNAGNNSISAAQGADQIDGAAGHDELYGNQGDDYLDGGVGNDFLSGAQDNDTLYGGAGSDQLDGGTGHDELYGGDGSDMLIMSEGIDFADGGAGIDTMTAQSHYAGVTAHLAEGVMHDLFGNAATFQGVENLTGSGTTDSLTGDAGNNRLDGWFGVDTLAGGRGNDTFVVDDVNDVVIELSNQGTDLVLASVSYSLAGYHVENLTLTGSDHLTATGNSRANILTGNDGNNLINGDTGADTMIGGLGNDTFIVDHVGDVALDQSGGGNDLVQAGANHTLSAFIENLILTGTLNYTGTGNSLSNAITGNSGNNVLDGGTGADTLTGGAGDDTYYVDNVADTVVEASGKGTDTIFSSVTYDLAGRFIEVLQLTGSANINATGNSQSQTLIGNSGKNVLNGGAGNDILTGGLGADTFQFTSGFRADSITDFNSGQGDKIQLVGLGSYTLTQVGGDVTVDFGGGNIITVQSATVATVSANII